MPTPGQSIKPVANGKPVRFVNRGPAGLLNKVKSTDPPKPKKDGPVAPYQIAPALQHLAVDINTLVPDPMNARLHPTRNKEAICKSLTMYGQVKPVVVRKETNVIVAGNGTTECAKELGWEKIAAVFVDMNEIEAAGFGVADNRTAELAKWDIDVLRTLTRLQLEAGLDDIPGWAEHEIEVLRSEVWVAPTITDEELAQSSVSPIKVTKDERDTIEIALIMVREREGNLKLTDGECLVFICNEWMIPPERGTNADSGEPPTEDDPIPF